MILREYYHRVRADADFAGAGQSIGSFLASFYVRCGMIVKIWAIVVGVTVKACFPQSGPRKTDDITIAVLIRHINHHNDAIGWALFVPAMESDELGPIVKMIDMDILSSRKECFSSLPFLKNRLVISNLKTSNYPGANPTTIVIIQSILFGMMYVTEDRSHIFCSYPFF